MHQTPTALATPHGNCNENQYSDPFVGPDGALYVAFNNFNNAVTGADNRNQVLLAKSTDGGDTFSAPVKVSDYYDLPDCDTYQGAGADPGRACVPEKGSSTVSVFRATNYPSGAVNPKNPNQVVVTLGSYINQHSNESNGCVPTGFAAVRDQHLHRRQDAGACNNDILAQRLQQRRCDLHRDDDRSAHGDDGEPGSRARRRPTSSGSGRRSRRTASSRSTTTTGSTAMTRRRARPTSRLSGTQGPREVRQQARHVVVDAGADAVRWRAGGQFYGDYIWLDTAGNDAFPIWSDTRDPDLFLCPGTGTPGNPPTLCTATENTGLQANDENTYMATNAGPDECRRDRIGKSAWGRRERPHTSLNRERAGGGS